MTLPNPLVRKPRRNDPFATWGGAQLNSPKGWLLGQGNSHEGVCTDAVMSLCFQSFWVDPQCGITTG